MQPRHAGERPGLHADVHRPADRRRARAPSPGMDAALRRYGTLTLAEAIAPAERLARARLPRPDVAAAARSRRTPSASRCSRRPRRAVPARRRRGLRPGATLVQPELAATLRRIMRGGRSTPSTAARSRSGSSRHAHAAAGPGDPSLLTVGDFARYRAIWRTPLRGQLPRARPSTPSPPPTSGGVALLEMLGHPRAASTCARSARPARRRSTSIAEAQKLAFADRALPRRPGLRPPADRRPARPRAYAASAAPADRPGRAQSLRRPARPRRRGRHDHPHRQRHRPPRQRRRGDVHDRAGVRQRRRRAGHRRPAQQRADRLRRRRHGQPGRPAASARARR